MKYEISKTSDCFGEDKPCKKAFKETVPMWDERTCTEEYYDENLRRRGKKWRDEYCNHQKVGKSGIKRQTGFEDKWFVEITTLEQLHKLIDEVGRMIIFDEYLEIYDDYRE